MSGAGTTSGPSARPPAAVPPAGPSRPSTALVDRAEALELAAAAVLGGLVLALDLSQGPEPAWRVVVDVAVGVAALALLLRRHQHPVGVAVLVVLASTVSPAVMGAVLLAVVSLATHRRWRSIAAVGGLFVVVTLTGAQTSDRAADWRAELALTVAVYGLCAASGAYLGSRRDLETALRERARSAEREQAARVEQAQVAERTRIAREMHDVLAHRIALVSMHAGVLAYRPDLPADERVSTAAVVQENANLALLELRQVLGVLRADGGRAGAPEAPQPTLPDVAALVQGAARGGQDVRLRLDPEDDWPARVPRTLSRHAYRLVQEGLTNARKHAPGARVDVTLSAAGDGQLVVDVVNGPARAGDPAPPGSGMGLVGAAERARLVGGRLVHGRDGSGGYRLHAELPWQPGEEQA
ncbi:histidine kinase [Cellulomonas sp. ACRRI]|uniref:sensor histidine kinase n=1 Tax=Cellulomonas sp. ACRRI TaxID=2918188 RepID=UPI001EF2E5F5|nr:histidine kinase [Cellulomonas sp. ACRRI]MCG7286862.1 histidine kinase [Cellulomonas sp. ACRRI]